MSEGATGEPDEQQSPQQRRFVRRLVMVIVVVGLIAVALVILGLAWTAILTVFGGVLIGVLLDGVADRIAGWTRMPRSLALVLVLLLGVGALVGSGFWLGPALAEHFEGLREQLALAWQDLRAAIAAREWGPRVLDELPSLDASWLLSPRLGGLLSTTLGSIASLALVAVFGIYFAVDPARYINVIVLLLPPDRRSHFRELFSAIARALRSWFVGRFFSMAIVGAGTALGLWIAGVPLALPLGILAGVLSFVPNLGPILSAIPGILVGFSVSPMTALWAFVTYIIVQLIESNALTPIVEQWVVSIPPAYLLAFQMLMGLSGGLIGLFMATPVLVTIVVIVQFVYLRDTLGDRIRLIGEPAEPAPPQPAFKPIEPA